MVGKLTIQLTESDVQIQKKINRALSVELNSLLKRALVKIQQKVKPVVRTALRSSPEIASLTSGSLRLDFGLQGDPTMDIINTVVSSVVVSMSPVKLVGKSVRGGIVVGIQPEDFSSLLSLSVARQRTERGVSLPWLDWLLNLGDTLIITDFGVQYGPYGRTGGAHMITKNRPFKVDTRYSGTADNNFITRSLSRFQPQIGEAIAASMKES